MSSRATPGSHAAGDREAGGHEGQEGLSHLVQSLCSLGEKHETVSVHQIREEIGERSFGPFLVVPSMIELSPVGGIPGVPTALAAIVSLFSVQIAFGMKHLWLPDFVENRKMPGDKLQDGLNFLRPPARWIDKVLKPRLRWITKPPALQVIAVACLLLAAAVPPLEIVPFGSSLPMGAIGLFGLALTVRDGLLAFLATALAAATLYTLYTLIL
nr:exoD-like membrane protein [Rhizobium sp. Khangiran2]